MPLEGEDAHHLTQPQLRNDVCVLQVSFDAIGLGSGQVLISGASLVARTLASRWISARESFSRVGELTDAIVDLVWRV